VKWDNRTKTYPGEFTYYFHAHREWDNAETYSFTTVDLTGARPQALKSIADRFYVFHKQGLDWGPGSATLQEHGIGWRYAGRWFDTAT